MNEKAGDGLEPTAAEVEAEIERLAWLRGRLTPAPCAWTTEQWLRGLRVALLKGD